MITLEKAKRTAAAYEAAFPLCSTAIDIGDAWVFFYDTGNPPVPGVYPVMVNKQTGALSSIPTPVTEPDFDKLDAFDARLDAGTEVPI